MQKLALKLSYIISFQIILAMPYMCVYELYSHTNLYRVRTHKGSKKPREEKRLSDRKLMLEMYTELFPWWPYVHSNVVVVDVWLRVRRAMSDTRLEKRFS